MTLDELITQTRGLASSSEPLEVLASAARRQQELADLGEKLLDHFVQEARTAGCSWSQIGSSLGVTKQAAQQRHSALRSLIGKVKATVESSLESAFTRFTGSARHVVVQAQEEAQRLGHQHIGTEHLLLGLVREGEGVAAQALVKLGAELETVRTKVLEQLKDYKGDVPLTALPTAAPLRDQREQLHDELDALLEENSRLRAENRRLRRRLEREGFSLEELFRDDDWPDEGGLAPASSG